MIKKLVKRERFYSVVFIMDFDTRCYKLFRLFISVGQSNNTRNEIERQTVILRNFQKRNI